MESVADAVGRILVVEDDAVTRRAIVRALRAGATEGAGAGMAIVEEADGQRAVDALVGGAFDCAFLDYQLPGLDGLSVLRTVRAAGVKTPVVIITAKGDEQLAVEMMKAGAADYLPKGRMSPEALSASLRNAVRVHRAEMRAADAADRLRANEERLSRILGNTLDGVVILDREHRFLYTNPAAERIFGVSGRELMGRSLGEVPWRRTRADGSELELADHPVLRVLATCQPVRGVELTLHRTDGTRVVLSVNAAPMHDPGGARVSSVVASIRDVTGEKAAEEALRAERQALRAERDFTGAVIDTSGALIIVLDPEGRIVRFNHACERAAGRSAAEVAGRNFADLFVPLEERDAVRAVFRRLSAGQFPSHYENHWLHRSGRRRLISWSNTCLTDAASGAVTYVIANGIDITEERAAEEALRRSQQDYAALVDSLDGIVWEADAATFRFSFVSRQAERILGYPVERWLGEEGFWERHIHPADREWARDFCVAATARGEDHEFEYRMIAADGRTVWLRDAVALVREEGDASPGGAAGDGGREDEGGEGASEGGGGGGGGGGGPCAPPDRVAAVKLRGLMIDVTERKQAEALRETQNRVLQLLVTGSSLDDLLTALVHGVEDQVPGAICTVLYRFGGFLFPGPSPSLPEPLLESISGGIPVAEGAGACGTAAATGRRVIIEDVLGHPACESWCRMAAGHGLRACWSQPITSSDGEVLGTFAIYHPQPRGPRPDELHALDAATALAEIAIRRKRDEGALRETNHTLSTLFDNSPLPIIAVNRDRTVRIWNPAAQRLFGFSAEEVLGRYPPIVPDDKADEADGMMSRALGGEAFTGVEVQRLRKDGTLIDVSFSAAPLLDARGQVSGVMAVILDVTERNRLKEQLLQSQKMEAIGRLAGGIAHDFNNLLAVISGYGESLARRLPGDSPLRVHAGEIQRAAERGGSLTRQLLAFSRRQVVRPQRLDLNRIVRDLHDMLRRVISDEIALAFKPGRGLRPVEADPGQIEQVVVNLALNARDAMPGAGTLTIRTANADLRRDAARLAGVRPGPYVRLTVSDTGVGMDATTRQHIFEPFFTTKEGKGTGLGLSIVYGIAQQAGGSVSVESAPGHGARFDVYFPAALPTAAAAPAAAAAAAAEEAARDARDAAPDAAGAAADGPLED